MSEIQAKYDTEQLNDYIKIITNKAEIFDNSSVDETIHTFFYKMNPFILNKLIPFFNLIDGEETEKNILDIGGGTNSFSLSTHIIDVFENKEKNIFKVDIDFEAFPFYNKQFLFSFCRHTLEDIQNPSNAFNEIIRVSQKGYIETPSPLAELTRGVEGNLVGYCHHRYIVWSERNKHLVFFT